jgi:glutathione S-transferase
MQTSIMDNRYRLIGGPGSPYSLKIRAILRYRRIAFDWLLRAQVGDEVAHIRPPVIPILHDPRDDSFRNDSTPLVEFLEEKHPDARSVVPVNLGAAFLNFLLEDFSDEWATKFMFQHRWLEQEDQDFYGHYLGWFREAPAPWEVVKGTGEQWRDRQISRNGLVGVSRANQPIIDRTFHGVLDALEKLVGSRMFLFGDRPASADFALAGQLQPGAHAPGASAEMRKRAPMVFCWLIAMDDLSGWNVGEWHDVSTDPSDAAVDLLRLSAQTHLPFFEANARAFANRDTLVDVELWGQRYRQQPFKYQARCFDELKRRFADLPEGARQEIEPLLDETGCLRYLA